MKFTVKAEVKTPEEITANLTLREQRDLTKAEARVAEAERKLEETRAMFWKREAECKGLPTAISRGERDIQDLEETQRKRDAIALMIPAQEAVLVEARALLEKEQAAARKALEAAVALRREELERAAREVAPLLEALRAADDALARVLDPKCWTTGVTWPPSWDTELEQRNAELWTNAAIRRLEEKLAAKAAR